MAIQIDRVGAITIVTIIRMTNAWDILIGNNISQLLGRIVLNVARWSWMNWKTKSNYWFNDCEYSQ